MLAGTAGMLMAGGPAAPAELGGGALAGAQGEGAQGAGASAMAVGPLPAPLPPGGAWRTQHRLMSLFGVPQMSLLVYACKRAVRPSPHLLAQAPPVVRRGPVRAPRAAALTV